MDADQLAQQLRDRLDVGRLAAVVDAGPSEERDRLLEEVRQLVDAALAGLDAPAGFAPVLRTCSGEPGWATSVPVPHLRVQATVTLQGPEGTVGVTLLAHQEEVVVRFEDRPRASVVLTTRQGNELTRAQTAAIDDWVEAARTALEAVLIGDDRAEVVDDLHRVVQMAVLGHYLTDAAELVVEADAILADACRLGLRRAGDPRAGTVAALLEEGWTGSAAELLDAAGRLQATRERGAA